MILTVLKVNNASLGVGRVAAVGTLVGNLLGGDTLRDDIGLVSDLLGRGPDGLPVYVSERRAVLKKGIFERAYQG